MPLYPFTAIVGQEKMRLALLLNAVNPLIGGVLVRGEKGTAKSTMARSLAELLPQIEVVAGCPYQCHPESPFDDCPHCMPLIQQSQPLKRVHRPMRVITLPVNASEDRVCGTLDIEHTLKYGRKKFEPGVLAEVHRGILYVDEVNLLDDHIVDVLLDAAAMGVNTVEREGVRMSHPSRFILIGTMNPEEGDLRPQLLDRFGLCVDVSAIMELEERMEIVRRRLQWEANPQEVIQRFRCDQEELFQSILFARDQIHRVHIPDEILRKISELCIKLDIHSHRADIVITRTAQTLAAWNRREEIALQDVRQAAELALPHRVRRRPFEESRLTPQQIEESLQESQPASAEVPDEIPNDLLHSTPPVSTMPQSPFGQQEKVFEIGAVPEIHLPDMQVRQVERGSSGRQVKNQNGSGRGRYVRFQLPKDEISPSDIALDATLRAAVVNQRENAEQALAINVESSSLRVKVREQPTEATILLLVDASGSMGAKERMSAAKGAALELLRDAYVHRNKVGVIAFRKNTAEILLPPTNSVDQAHELLKRLPTGGKTPLGAGLMKAWELQRQLKQRDGHHMILTVLISDGKANVQYQPGSVQSAHEEAQAIARQMMLDGSHLLVLDTEDDFLTLGLARQLAEAVGADYCKLANLEGNLIANKVRAAL